VAYLEEDKILYLNLFKQIFFNKKRETGFLRGTRWHKQKKTILEKKNRIEDLIFCSISGYN
jgi:hypothetical protein